MMDSFGSNVHAHVLFSGIAGNDQRNSASGVGPPGDGTLRENEEAYEQGVYVVLKDSQ
jgi:hypothetical protein